MTLDEALDVMARHAIAGAVDMHLGNNHDHYPEFGENDYIEIVRRANELSQYPDRDVIREAYDLLEARDGRMISELDWWKNEAKEQHAAREAAERRADGWRAYCLNRGERMRAAQAERDALQITIERVQEWTGEEPDGDSGDGYWNGYTGAQCDVMDILDSPAGQETGQ